MTTHISKFPTKLPSPNQLEPSRVALTEVLHELTVTLMECQADLFKAANAPELARVVRETAKKIAEANSGWNELCDVVRDSWRV
jgi:hypothetical protein